jgi:hypothetical protein
MIKYVSVLMAMGKMSSVIKKNVKETRRRIQCSMSHTIMPGAVFAWQMF